MKEIMEPKNACRFSELPDEAVVNKATVILLLGGISPSNLYAGIKQGLYPKQVKFGRSSRWVVGEIRACLERQKNQRQ